MRMVEHTVEVRGPKVSDGRRSPDAIGNVLKWIEPLVRMTVSMAFRYTSQVRGRPPKWLASACTVRFADISDGNGRTCLHFEAPRLGEAAEDLYRQGQLFRTRPEANDTAFDLIGDVLRDVIGQRPDSNRFDTDLLKRFHRFRTAESKWGVESLVFRGDRLPEESPLTVDKRVSELAGKLRRDTPQPRRGRIAGSLDMIRASDGAFTIILESGERANGILAAGKTDILAQQWRQFVVVEGLAVFRASGSLLRIEADDMAPCAEADRFFSVIPEPCSGSLDERELRQTQTRRSGVAAIFGEWPGDETEEEILAALKGSG